jgi:hypothetical protein
MTIDGYPLILTDRFVNRANQRDHAINGLVRKTSIVRV